jgi:tRNA pseudouridine38-40 synthase
MPRYKLLLEYDGAPFVGWQRQENGASVQQALETALTAWTRERVTVQAAGRTDAGVHATGQVAHVDLEQPRATDRLRDATNFHLRPAPVAVLTAEEVAPDFHARFSATGRRYIYRLLDRPGAPALERGRVWWSRRRLDVEAMGAAAQLLIGRHDFTSFRAALCQAASPVKTLDRLEVTRVGAEIHVEAEARSFLHHQVRNMVGTLRLVGDGKWPVERVGLALAARNRAAAGPTAPPEGLCLVEVRY